MSRNRSNALIEVDLDELRRVLADTTMPDDTKGKFKALLDTVDQILAELGTKRVSVARLRRMLFGSKSEKSKKLGLDGAGSERADEHAPSSTPSPDVPSPDVPSTTSSTQEPTPKRKGHGRNGAKDYPGAKQRDVEHSELKHGQICPECCRGKLCRIRPRRLLRLRGAAPVSAECTNLEQFRCALCGEVFTADVPDDVGQDKYDPYTMAIVARLKYGGGFPFSRLERLQFSAGVPLPAPTQWLLVTQLSNALSPVFRELVRQAAQGRLLHMDDTWIRIYGPIKRRGAPAKSPVDPNSTPHSTADTIVSQNRPRPNDRTGTFTTGLLSYVGEHAIALFLTGWRHAGENLSDVLSLRAPGAERPIQMCDALSRNMPKELATIVANCLAHGRREFVELLGSFKDQCEHVINELAHVFHADQVARDRAMSDLERLAWHQEQSGPVMEDLAAWMKAEVAEKRVEPNSPLGKTFAYMHKHWDALTLFLRVPGAPIDNNVLERALKIPILNRNNAKYFRSQNGATVADVLMSTIYTAERAGKSSLHYLASLYEHRAELAANPEDWMPWNYEQTIANAAAMNPSLAA
jgi:transposase